MSKSPTVSVRLRNVSVSATRKLSAYAELAKSEGVKIYHLNIGDPDIKTPEVMLEALHNFNHNPIRYANSRGEKFFLDSLKWYYDKFGASFLKESDMVVTVGGSEAIDMAFFSVAGQGDEILVFEPFYSNYETLAGLIGVNLVGVPSTSLESGFHLPERSVIEKAITEKTKAILICTPSNPTGTVYTWSEMELLVDIAKKRNLFLISDEVYREFVYDRKEHVSLLSFMEEIPEHAILLDSLSKRYSLCGARLGVLVSQNKEVVSGVAKLAQGRLSAGFIEQVMAEALTKVPDSYTEEVIAEYKKRRDTVYEGMSKIPGVTLARPEGAFYTMVNLPVDDAEKFSIYLLEKFRLNNETVMLSPGEGYYKTKGEGRSQVRIAYVLKVEELKKCIEIIRAALEEYSQK